MKHIVFIFYVLGIILTSCTQNKAPKFDHYGVYLQNGDEYIQLKDGNEIKLPEIAVDGEVVLFVYAPTTKNQKYNFAQGQGAKIEHTMSPVEGNNEMVKLSSEVFGGRIHLGVRGEKNGNYKFEANNTTIKKSLEDWMTSMIEFYDQKDYRSMFENSTPQRRLSRIKPSQVEEIIQRMNEHPEEFEKMINQIKIDLKKLQKDEGVEIDIPECSICIGANCYYHWGGDKLG